jgi:hypothetical protein
MRCKELLDGEPCGCPVMYITAKGPTKQTCGDEGSVGKKSKGFPMKPIKPTDYCYYHAKERMGLFEGGTYGRSSDLTQHSGRPRIYDEGR